MSNIIDALKLYQGDVGLLSLPGGPIGLSDDEQTYKFAKSIISLCRSPEAAAVHYKQKYDRLPKADQDEVSRIFANARNLCRCNYTRIVSMFEEYNKAIIKKGIISDATTFTDTNRIDARELIATKYPTTDEKRQDAIALCNAIMEYNSEVGFYGMIPCFNKGIIDVTPNMYVAWSIFHLDLDNSQMTLGCSVYITGESCGCSFDIPFTEFIVDIGHHTIGDGIHDTITYQVKTFTSLNEMFTAISPKQMRWNQQERLMWNKTYMRMVKFVDKISPNPAPYDSILELLTDMIFAFTGVNYHLHKNRQWSRRRKGKDEPTVIVDFNQAKQDARITRKIGLLTIVSRDIPRETTRENVIRYQVASWTVRGHVRRYKSGKMVYIEPHTSHRRCMQPMASDQTPGPRSIEIEKKVEEG